MATAAVSSRESPFLNPGTSSRTSSLAILHLRRDQLLPTFLREEEENDTGYREGAVTNTRFGSYPHSTISGIPWGSQVLASRVDTGSRGRRDPAAGQKRKRGESSNAGATDVQKEIKHEGDDQTREQNRTEAKGKDAVAASTGFCHVLPPTPEAWTVSLPHRTQVVYTPDYSYILQKIRVRPGSVVIEAGAGSGSFTHAAARAAFSGYREPCEVGKASMESDHERSAPQRGRVFSFEYHEPRAKQLQAEIEEHGLSAVVQIAHRDVYKDGFLIHEAGVHGDQVPKTSPLATQVFLDLPAPWQALPHLTRAVGGPLDPKQTCHVCIFLPCMEQAQRAVTSLRAHGWVEINMQELQHRRVDIRRERVGLDLQGLRNVNATPASLEEAVERLKEVEKNGRRYQNAMVEKSMPGNKAHKTNGERGVGPGSSMEHMSKKADRLARNAEEATSRKAFREGRLTHRTEPEIRTHTSYLIFAVLPIEWTEADEARCKQQWPPEQALEQAKCKGK